MVGTETKKGEGYFSLKYSERTAEVTQNLLGMALRRQSGLRGMALLEVGEISVTSNETISKKNDSQC